MSIATDISISQRAADNIRVLSAAMVEKAKSGHPGGAMGGADFIHILFSEFLRFDPSNSEWFLRDRFFLDPGHMSPMLYAQLSMIGKFSMDELSNFRQWGSPTPGHPEKDFARGIENTSGPLGQGHVMGIGAAIAAKFLASRFGNWMDQTIYAFISDGGIQEEISQGAGRIAGHLGLNNFVMFYDANQIQLSTKVKDVTSEDVAKKYEAWGWNVIEIDGNCHESIRKALTDSKSETEKPTIIIGNTIMGKGACTAEGESFESQVSTHGQPLSKAGASFEKTVENLGGSSENPFQIFPEVADFYATVLKRKAEEVEKIQSAEAEWAANNKEAAAKLENFISGKLPQMEWDKIEQKEGVATRAASSAVLAHLADHVENMIVASADLANSDKTDGFLKKTKAFTRDDFSGQFLQAGVAEFTMAALANGMALHGGVIPAVGTFFVFSDYMKPALRLSALMELPVVFIWTHDAFRVGEDGPTHQPIEQEAQIRLMEQLKNHSGKPSTLVMRPCDAAETTAAWRMALENTETPSALILSRQNIMSLPAVETTRVAEAAQAVKGGYVVRKAENPDVVLVANGSEVATMYQAADLLEEKGIKAQVSAFISEGQFRLQDADYQAAVLPDGVSKVGLTAGLPVTLQGLVRDGLVLGLDHFGYSAPAGVLDEKFGFTPDQVAGKVVEFLK